ncbi:unnamed protein product [Parnassius mnemosyne]|uniref:Uncharacterized protein n=1 Tax=Parnassius mnemosyne TaxID=213953 RepID=A0AAV1KIG5_9NEOP
MNKILIFICCLYYLNVIPFEAYAMTVEQKAQIHEHFEKIGIECIKDNTITEEDINNLRAHKIASGPNVPCFLACMLKEVGIMDDKGMLEKETALEHAKKIFNDAEELKLMEDYLHSCAHINGESVSDGEKGCERASSAYKCMIENASQFGIDL